ncbi:hypothetical protein DdX_10544 [Ditylenchus destructor]|uniref:Uncharacterized protein n=1 Tax=Ditylenchus destructor TaxID=166010 RepID=A0AAD4N0N1_9BILA|nr:hypothetical protein DdX_10544 [Ditylenchus destructor]
MKRDFSSGAVERVLREKEKTEKRASKEEESICWIGLLCVLLLTATTSTRSTPIYSPARGATIIISLVLSRQLNCLSSA